MTTAVFIFHRDLRLYDNTALNLAIKQGYRIIPIFIFTDTQIDRKKNKYFSDSSVQFMCESLPEELNIFKGSNTKILTDIYKKVKFEAVFQNEDYSIYSRERDAEIQAWCKQNAVLYQTAEDYGLTKLQECLVNDDHPYTNLSQFYARFLRDDLVRPVDKFIIRPEEHFIKLKDIKELDTSQFYVKNDKIAMHGGRKNALDIIANANLSRFKTYDATRNYPANERGTTQISAYLKFGCISIREMYHACVTAFKTRDHPLIRELVFREMYLKYYALNPKYQRDYAPRDKLDKAIKWSYSKKDFKTWCNGQTGYPLVDAAMHQLNTTGYMHNRVRMVVSSFLTRYLGIDWRLGMKYFYQKLVDSDVYSNTAGWGFGSGIGIDSAPYFRAPMNPFLQSKKYDPNAEYIKRWVPELRNASPNIIHKWYDPKIRASASAHSKYPAPMIEQSFASKRAIEIFKEAYNNSI